MSTLHYDEAGRGPLAGPVAVWVVLPRKRFRYHTFFTDSKTLSERKRDEAFREIQRLQDDGYLLYWVWMSSASYIDKYGIMKALEQASLLATQDLFKTNLPLFKLQKLIHKEARRPKIVVDGTWTFGLDRMLKLPVKSIIKGDLSNPRIGMASICAKVTRDQRMRKAHAKHPEYGFAYHYGYGTQDHKAAIAKYGYSPVHRQSFVLKTP